MTKILNSKFYILAFIIIIAAFFRLYNITLLPPGLYPDEAMNGNNALEALSPNGQLKWFYPENNGREGLFINMQAVSIYIFGNEPWALRSVSAIFGILTVLGVYLLALELFPKNKKIALLAAFLIATSFWHILFSRIGFRAITAPFYLTWACYFLLKAVRQLKEQKSLKLYILNSIFSGILYGLGFHSYIAYRATPLLMLAGFAYQLFFFKELRSQIIKIFLVFSVFSILAFLPLGIHFLKQPADFFGRTTQVSVFNSETPLKDLGMNILKTAAMFNFFGDWNWRHNYAGKPELFWPVGILFIIGVVFGISVLLKKKSELSGGQNPEQFKKFSFLMLFLWIIIASLPIVISNEGLPHALRAILLIPPVFILSAVGGIWLIENFKSQISNLKNSNQKLKIFYLLLVIFYLLLIINAYKSYFIDWGKNSNIQGAFSADYVQMGRELNALPNPPTGGLLKHVIVEADGVDVRGIPMPAQTIMFITDTFTPEKQKEKNIFYILPNQKNLIPENSYKIILR